MRKNIRGCFFFTAQGREGEEEKKKKPKGKAGKTGGSSLFLLVLMKRDTKCSPAEAEEEMNGGRGTTTLVAHKTQIPLNIFFHNGFRLFSPLPSAGWGSPRPQGSAVEGAPRKTLGGEGGMKIPGGKGENEAPRKGERGERRPSGEGKSHPRDTESTAGGRWSSERRWLEPGSPRGAEGAVRAALTSPLVMLIAK